MDADAAHSFDTSSTIIVPSEFQVNGNGYSHSRGILGASMLVFISADPRNRGFLGRED